jgi:hypothetical protein
MSVNTADSTNRLLKVVIALLIQRQEEKVRSLKEQIFLLSNLGIRPSEIAEILGKTSTHINKELSGLRKNRKGEK